MKTRKWVGMMGLSILLVIGSNALAADQANAAKNRAELEAMVDDCIAKCHVKAVYMNSESKSLRRTAALAVMKEAYFKTHRQQLVNEMLAAGIEPKGYRVVYHLNARFYEAVRPQAVARRWTGN
ncbi:MAG: hypothetical protein ACOWWM_01255 [Desulfobacterales bacterium]